MKPSTSDVITLMDIGLKNRVVGSTALNERRSRSHSIVIVHVRGIDFKTGYVLYGKDVRDLMEQLASLKDTIARKDKEIERLHQVKDIQHHETGE
ncbi:unnamed protein product [Arabidopsis lyrata]|uniref:Kinesin motor domain-containing protein n=1 Tax=Arabidopsis lyrata subsp. lyrata TaxID=81972 RepID=D7LF76_ARALL|nr:hypothetical protein ARALYDRAFT_904138 [Arabidopsis lyrata subsp. lyrata]CAH8266200.1 unnamed protein product [Arabidopsis lyrata]